jgi:CheY-like chemotaxis protein
MNIARKVLLVDDDRDDLELLQEAIKKMNDPHEILEAYNGE